MNVLRLLGFVCARLCPHPGTERQVVWRIVYTHLENSWVHFSSSLFSPLLFIMSVVMSQHFSSLEWAATVNSTKAGLAGVLESWWLPGHGGAEIGRGRLPFALGRFWGVRIRGLLSRGGGGVGRDILKIRVPQQIISKRNEKWQQSAIFPCLLPSLSSSNQTSPRADKPHFK